MATNREAITLQQMLIDDLDDDLEVTLLPNKCLRVTCEKASGLDFVIAVVKLVEDKSDLCEVAVGTSHAQPYPTYSPHAVIPLNELKTRITEWRATYELAQQKQAEAKSGITKLR